MLQLSQNHYLLFILILFVSIISLLYFYIFTRNHEKYINYWGLSWVMYAFSLVFNIFLASNPSSAYLIALKQICDLLNSLFLLTGTYYFIGKKFPHYWIQFTIVNIIWIGLAAYYNLSFLTITLLSSAFFNIIAIITGIMLLKFWQTNRIEKIIIISIFFIWGIHKAYYPYLYPEFRNSSLGYVSEIVLANLLNLCIMLIYLQKIKDQLTNSEKLFRLLAENAQDMIYVYRLIPNEHFEYVSPSCEKIIGYKPEDFYQDPNLLEEIVHPEDKAFLNALFDPFSSFSEPLTLRWKHKSDFYVWAEQKSTFFVDNESHTTRIEGIIRDITDRKKVEESLINAEKSRQTLLTNISHELRTPITSIVGYIAAIKEGRFKKQTLNNYIDLIYNKSLFLQRLVQDLFQLTQFESGRISFNFSQITVSEFIEDVIEKYRFDVVQKNIHFNIDFNQSDLFLQSNIIIDIERINQVLSNILFNAIKFTPPQGSISIYLKNQYNENNLLKKNLLISIKDTGPGISEKDINNIFNRFYRSKSNKDKFEGSGLGLAISKEIIESHKGSIWVESQINKGTAFHFTIPIYTP